MSKDTIDQSLHSASDASHDGDYFLRNDEKMLVMEKQGIGTGVSYASRDDKFFISDVKFAPNRWESESVAGHVYISLCRSGGGAFIRGSHRRIAKGYLSPGDVQIVCPQPGFFEHSDIRLTSVVVDHRIIESIWSGFGYSDFRSSLDDARVYRDLLLEQLVLALSRHVQAGSLTPLLIDHILSTMLGHMGAAESVSSRSSGLSPRQVNIVTDYVRQRLADEIGLIELSRLVNLSIAEFSRRFKTTHGSPPYAYITKLRMSKAASLMENPSLTLCEIGARVGYPNPSQFARAFGRSTGVSPSQWRKMHAD